MRPPANTVPPLMGEESSRSSLLDLLRSPRRQEGYYEARDRRDGLYLLWMEAPRFGTRLGYPCVLRERDAAPLVFGRNRLGSEEEDERLLDRWRELEIPERAASLEITTLDKTAFRRKYQAFLRGETD